MDSLAQYPLDYRATSVVRDTPGGTVHDLEAHLKKTYAENVTVEFE
jgi:hypothetical protein